MSGKTATLVRRYCEASGKTFKESKRAYKNYQKLSGPVKTYVTEMMRKSI